MLDLTYKPQDSEGARTCTEYDYLRKYQSPEASAEFAALRRDLSWTGATFEDAKNGFKNLSVSFTGINRSQDYLDYIPEVFLAEILELTQTGPQIGRQIAPPVSPPELHPKIYWREHERWVEPQVVFDDEPIDAHKGKMAKRSRDFWTIGDRWEYSWNSLKDLPISPETLDMAASGRMIDLMETRFAIHELRRVTSDGTFQEETFTNYSTYNNASRLVYDGSTQFPFEDLLAIKCDIGAPSADTHPALSQLERDARVNLYDPDWLLVPPFVYKYLLTNRQLMNNGAFWRNSEILDNSIIRTMFGLNIARIPAGYFQDDFTWVPANDCYFIDRAMARMNLYMKAPLQTWVWDDMKNRHTNFMVLQRCNAVCRNPRAVHRLAVVSQEDPYEGWQFLNA